MNRVQLIGYVGDDPDIRSGQKDQGVWKMAILSLATNEYYRDRETDTYKKLTQWHRLVVKNNHLVDIIDQYITKGSRLYIEGQLQTRKWLDEEDQDRFTTEVVLSGYKSVITILDKRDTKEEDEETLEELTCDA